MTRRWTGAANPDEILCDACIVIHKCDDDDGDGDPTDEWEFVVHDENDDGICEFIFWEDDA